VECTALDDISIPYRYGLILLLLTQQQKDEAKGAWIRKVAVHDKAPFAMREQCLQKRPRRLKSPLSIATISHGHWERGEERHATSEAFSCCKSSLRHKRTPSL